MLDPSPTPPPAPRRALKDETVLRNEYKDYDVDYVEAETGEFLRVTVRARKLGWKERVGLEDRFTHVTPGRGRLPATSKVDVTGLMSATLAAAIDAPNCDPPLMLDQITPSLWHAIVTTLKLNNAAAAEEGVLGES